MVRHRTRSLIASLAIFMLLASGIFTGVAAAETGNVPGADDESRALQQTVIGADYLCKSYYTNQFRLVFSPNCKSNEQLIQLSTSLPFDYCYSYYTGILSDDRPGDTCPSNSQYVEIDGLSSFFACYDYRTGRLLHMNSPSSPCNTGIIAGFIDLRGSITKYACVEENSNAEGCDVFAAGPHNEIRQIGPIPNTSGGFQDCLWQWVFDGNNSPTQSCNNDSSNADIEAALEALPGINDVTVTGGPIAGTTDAPIRIEFVGVDAQTDIIPQIEIVNQGSTVNQKDSTVLNGAVSGPEVSYIAPGGTVQLFYAAPATDPNNPATYGPEVTAGSQAVDAEGKVSFTDLLEGDYVVCADGTGSVSASCEIVTVNANVQTIVNNVDLPGMITAAITDTVGTNEIQTYDDIGTFGPVTGGTYTITFDGSTTGALAFDADAATIEAALEALLSINGDNITVTGGPPNGNGPAVVIEFTNALGGQNVPSITIDNSSLTGSGFFGYFVDPDLTDVDGSGETQTLTGDARVSGGTFTLTYDNGSISSTTGPLDWDATVTEIEAALNGLASINSGGGGVTVTSTDPDFLPGNETIIDAPINVQFDGVANADTNVLVVDNTNLE